MNSQLTRHDPRRQVPIIRVDEVVQIESTDLCHLARITATRRTGRNLEYVLVTLVPYERETFENAGDYDGRETIMIRVNDDGSAAYKFDGAPSIEIAYF